MWVSRMEETDNVRDSVQVNNPLKLQNNASDMRSPLKMNFRTAQRVNSMQGATNEAGVLITLSGTRRTNTTSAMSLSNIDMNLFAAD